MTKSPNKSSGVRQLWNSQVATRKDTFERDVASIGARHRWLLSSMFAFIAIIFGSLIIENFDFDRFVGSRSGRFIVPELASQDNQSTSSATLNFVATLDADQIALVRTGGLFLPLNSQPSASVQINDLKAGDCLAGVPCMIGLGFLAPDTDQIRINIRPTGSTSLAIQKGFTPVLTDGRGLREILTFTEKVRNEENRRISVYARILLSLFCIIVFLSIERSPETLGLALFSGLESIALLFGFNGILPPALPAEISYVLPKHFSWALADFFRLFFTLQICRIGRASITPWIKVGVVASLAYGFIRHGQYHFGWTWAAQTWAYKDFLFGTSALVIAIVSLAELTKQRQARRALTVGLVVIATLPEVGVAAADLFFDPQSFGYFSTFFTFLEANSVFLLAVCTLLNISDLESKVKNLLEQRKADFRNEKELELARDVQQSLLQEPYETEDVAFRLIYQPATYVSGDMYFSYWDEKSQKGVLLLYDVVGHGVQAALKAAAAFAVADTMWNSVHPSKSIRRQESRRSESRRLEDSKLVRFEQLVQRHLIDRGKGEDFCAMVGIEFDLAAGRICAYRANYGYPVLVETGGGCSTARQLVIPNRQPTWFDIKENSRILLLSDGIVSGGRAERHLIKEFGQCLPLSLEPTDTVLDALRVSADSAFKTAHDDITVLEIVLKRISGAQSQVRNELDIVISEQKKAG